MYCCCCFEVEHSLFLMVANDQAFQSVSIDSSGGGEITAVVDALIYK